MENLVEGGVPGRCCSRAWQEWPRGTDSVVLALLPRRREREELTFSGSDT